jgi:cytochrome P450
MADEITLTGRADVQAGLEEPALVPPPAPAGIGRGAVARLRAAMARFSGPEDHAGRRAAVMSVIEGFDLDQLRQAAAARTAGWSDDEAGRHVPVAVLASALGVEDGDLDAVVDDVGRVAEVIGRGEDVTAAADDAAERLLARFADHPDGGAVAVVSVLYQSYDATAALLAETQRSRATGEPRRSAITRTVRTAVGDTEVAGVAIPEGTTVVLGLASADLEFGAGPHACPGQEVAQALVDGILDGLEVRTRDRGRGPGT